MITDVRGAPGCWLVAIAVLAAACGRGDFDPIVPGIAPVDGLIGVRVSEPGALVIDDGGYDVAPAIGGGYALGWMEFAPGEPTSRLMFAVVAEDGQIEVGPVVVELLALFDGGVRIWTGPDGYLLVVVANGAANLYALDPAGNLRARRANDSPLAYGLQVAPTPTGFGGVITQVPTGMMNDNVHFVGLDANGNITVPPVPVAPQATSQVNPVIAWTGADFAVVWVDNRAGRRLWFARVGPTGALVTPPVQIHEDGEDQGLPLMVNDGLGGFLVSYDAYDSFPVRLLRVGASGAPVWPSPVVIYDEPYHHDTLDVAGRDGRTGFGWITEENTVLGNVEFVAVDGRGDVAPVVPAPTLITDPTYKFCYPELARGATSFGTAFSGEVEGSLALFLAIVPDG